MGVQEELQVPEWVNHSEATEEEEATERLATPEELDRALGKHVYEPTTRLSLGSGEDNTQVLPDALAKSVALDTERLRREDWVDRTHRGEGRLAALGPGLISLIAILSISLLVMGVVWWGSAWVVYLLDNYQWMFDLQ